MTRLEELRLMARVAHLYYNQELKQSEIAEMLDLSQTTVSRLLKRAIAEKIVRISVNMPPGVFTETEEKLRAHYNLKEVIVAEAQSSRTEDIQRAVGGAAAFYIENTLSKGEIVGISSWSATLLAVVDAMHSLGRSTDAQIVQILGGIGNPDAEIHAARLTHRFAELLHARAVFLTAPGVVGSGDARRVLMDDPYVAEAVSLFDKISLALVGIGTLEPSKLLASSGNIFSSAEMQLLREQGAVGDICLRFFDRDGHPVVTPLNERVIGIPLEKLRNARRTVAVAGGLRKVDAIRGALEGKLINVLITDYGTAKALLYEIADGDG